jgi:hypothetical protein
MQPQQLDHGLYGWLNVQQRDLPGLARKVFVEAQQCADTGTVEGVHVTQVDDEELDPRLQELLALALKLPRGGRVQPRRLHQQVERFIFQLSLNDGGHIGKHAPIGRTWEPKI